MPRNYEPEQPKLEIADSELQFNIDCLLREKEDLTGEILKIIPGRDATREDYMYHLAEGSNAYAMGDRATWLFHKKLREKIQKAHYTPLQEAKDRLAACVEKLNPFEDEVLRREGKMLLFTGETLGTAVKTSSFPLQSAEWHAQRAKGIGGSDVAAILNLSPWTTREELFRLKTGQDKAKPSTPGKGALWRGAVWEDSIARQYQKSHEADAVFVNCKDSWRSTEREYQTANLDGLVYSLDESIEMPNRILEIKTSSTPDSWVDGVPVYYRLQALWYMDAFGIGEADFAVLLDDVELREFTIAPEAGEMDDIHGRVAEFVDEVAHYMKNN